MARDDRLDLVAGGAFVRIAVVNFSVFRMRLAGSCRRATSFVLGIVHWMSTSALALQVRRTNGRLGASFGHSGYEEDFWRMVEDGSEDVVVHFRRS